MAGFFAILLNALRGRREVREPAPITRIPPGFNPPELSPEQRRRLNEERLRRPGAAAPSVIRPPGWAELPPEDAEFLIELGMSPDEDLWEQPYTVPPIDRQAAIPREALQTILRGTWIAPLSSNVDEWRFVELDRAIDVKFLSGSMYRYTNCDRNVATQFYASPSAGRFVWYVLRANSDRDPVWPNPSGRFHVTQLRPPRRSAVTGRILFSPKRRLRLLAKGKRRRQ